MKVTAGRRTGTPEPRLTGSPSGGAEDVIFAGTDVITASEPVWTAPFTGLSWRSSGTWVSAPCREDADAPVAGTPWKLSPETGLPGVVRG